LGVAQRRTCIGKSGSRSSECVCLREVFFEPVGVCHNSAIALRRGDVRFNSAAQLPDRESAPLGVGQNEKSLAQMGSANGSRGEMTPFRSEPHFGNLVENEIEPAARSEPRDIFKKQQRRFDDDRGFGDVGPEPAMVLGALAFAGGAEGLAGEPRNEAVHHAAKRLPVAVFQIPAPNRRWLQALLFHPRQEAGCSVGIALTVAHSAGFDSEQIEAGSDSFVEPADSAAKREAICDGTIHVIAPPELA
jgi:hypothetical protein